MKRILKVLGRIIELALLVFALTMSTFLLLKNKYGYTDVNNSVFVSINEDNQQYLKLTKDGDLLIINKNNMGLHTGDLMYYYAAVNDKYVVKSGTVGTSSSDDYNALYTLDDEDKTTVAGTRVIGKDVEKKEGLGSTLDFLESRIGFLICVLLPILLVFIYEIYGLIVVIKYDTVEEEPKSKKSKKVNTSKNIEKKDDVEVL